MHPTKSRKCWPQPPRLRRARGVGRLRPVGRPGTLLVMRPPGNLPGQLTTFVGRQGTIAAVGRRLMEDRLVSLVGPGGCGKTRLAIEVGRQTQSSRPHGVFFVDLSGLSDPALVPGSVAHTVGLRDAGPDDPIEALVAHLAERDLLVLLDNCEHLLDAAAKVADLLARGCPRLWVLATSRHVLGLTGEVVVSVAGLELPDQVPGQGAPALVGSEAGQLFIDRAKRAHAGFCLDDKGVAAVSEICERLDGIPLALELAAARTRFMSVERIAQGLSDRFRLLAGSARAGPERHRTLLASIEWSCGLLSHKERRLLCRLSVFASGFTLAAAEHICGGGEVGPEEVLELVSALVDKSLVQVDLHLDRFRLHETMRAYTAAALDADGEADIFRDRHLDYFTEQAATLEPNTWTAEVASVVANLEPELGNLRAALDWSIESKQFNAGAALLGALGHFLYIMGLRSETWARCERLLACELSNPARAEVLFWAHNFSYYLDPSSTLRLAEELTALGRAAGNGGWVARGLGGIGFVQMRAQPEAAVATYEEAIPLARATGQRSEVVIGWCHKAYALVELGRLKEALACSEQAVAAGQEMGWLWGTTFAWQVNAWASLSIGDMARALECANAELQFGNQLGDPMFIGFAEHLLGEVARLRGDFGTAKEALARGRAVCEASGGHTDLPIFDAALAIVQLSLGQFDRAYEQLDAATVKWEALGFSGPGWRALLAEVAVKRGDLAAARQHLACSSKQLAGEADAKRPLTLRAAARLARAEGLPQKALGLACQALESSFSSGALLTVIELLELVAVAFSDLGEHIEAARLLGAAERQRELTGYVRPGPDEAELAPVRAGIAIALGGDGAERARMEGRGVSVEESVSYAARSRAPHRRAVSGWDSLTPTEHQVASLVYKRLTNAEIADRLFVSPVTVKSHLSRVFVKLGVSNRRQLAAAIAGREEEEARGGTARTEGAKRLGGPTGPD
jgi:predicted ATPase/DNA-binding CsgD family transcriptional regulator